MLLLCNLPTWRLLIDVTALRQIDRGEAQTFSLFAAQSSRLRSKSVFSFYTGNLTVSVLAKVYVYASGGGLDDAAVIKLAQQLTEDSHVQPSGMEQGCNPSREGWAAGQAVTELIKAVLAAEETSINGSSSAMVGHQAAIFSCFPDIIITQHPSCGTSLSLGDNRLVCGCLTTLCRLFI